MAVTISSPQFSFVQFGTTTDPCSGYPPCLPVNDLSDLQFTVLAYVTGSTDKANFLSNSYAVALEGLHTNNFEPSFIMSWEGLYSHPSPSDPDVYVGYGVYASTEVTFNALAYDTCFSLGFYQYTPERPYTYLRELFTTSTCFIKTSDTCYTSIIQYGNNSNAFGFYFSTPAANWLEKVRLPLYLHSPVNVDDEKSYQKSDGSTKKLSHRIWKDYKFKMDYLDEATIEKFNIATACDTVTITNPYLNVNALDFVRTEKVEIEYNQEDNPYFNLGISKGTLRLAIPRAYVNSNCQ
jgi:hypothetical protein